MDKRIGVAGHRWWRCAMRHVPATDEGSQGQLSVQREAGPSGYLKSTRRKIDGFCTLMQ